MKPDWWEWSFSGNKQTLYTDMKTFRQHKTNDTKHPLELQLHWKLCSDLATIESGANSPTSKDNGWDHHYRCEVGRTQNKLFSIVLHRQAIEATTMKILLTDIWPFSKYIRLLPRQPGPGMSARNQPPVLKQCMMGKLLPMWRQLYPLLCSLLGEYDWSAERWCHDHVMLWLVRVIKIQNDLDWAINFGWPSLCYRKVESSQPSS